MNETSAYLIDHVIPHLPVRQWILSVPIPMRYWLSTNPKLQNSVLKIIIRSISAYYKRQARKTSDTHRCKIGAITRFGSALNLNIHYHILFLEGFYKDGNPDLFYKFGDSPMIQKKIEKLKGV